MAYKKKKHGLQSEETLNHIIFKYLYYFMLLLICVSN